MLEVLLDQSASFIASQVQRALDFYHVTVKRRGCDDRWHFVMEFNGWNLTIQYLSHQSYIEKMTEQMAVIFYYLDPEDFIRITLETCKHCNCLVLDCEDERLFIQFWLADGKLMCSYPIKKTNNLDQHISSVVALLDQMDITQDTDSEREMPSHKYTFSISRESECEEYWINFGTDTQKAAHFSRRVIEEIFGYDFAKITFWLG